MNRITTFYIFIASLFSLCAGAQTVTVFDSKGNSTNKDQFFSGDCVAVVIENGVLKVIPSEGKGEEQTYDFNKEGLHGIAFSSAPVEPLYFNKPNGSSNGIASYVCDRALDLTLSPYTIYGYVATKASTSSTTLKNQQQFGAGDAMLIVGEPGWHCLPVATGKITRAKTNLFRGSTTAGHTVLTGEKTYALSKTYGTLNPVAVGLTIPAKKAYITVKAGVAMLQSLDFDFEEDEDTSDIDEMYRPSTTSTPLYNVAGQRINGNKSGIVVTQGAKLMK